MISIGKELKIERKLTYVVLSIVLCCVVHKTCCCMSYVVLAYVICYVIVFDVVNNFVLSYVTCYVIFVCHILY